MLVLLVVGGQPVSTSAVTSAAKTKTIEILFIL
jgi:hypothetical protein